MIKYFNFFIIIPLVLLTFDIVDNNRRVFYEIYCGNKTVAKYTNAPKNCKGKCESNLYRTICLRGQCVPLWQNHTKMVSEFYHLQMRTTTEKPTRLLLIKKKKKYGIGRKFNDYGITYPPPLPPKRT